MAAKPTVSATGQSPDVSCLGLSIFEHAPTPIAVVEGATYLLRYVNPAFCRLLAKNKDELLTRPFAEIMPQSDGCLTLLDRVYRTGEPANHTEQGRRLPHPVFWSYTIWPVPGADERRAGIMMMQVTETAKFHQQSVAMTEALLLASVRQHELTEAADQLNVELQAEVAERRRAAEVLAKQLDLTNDAIVVHDLEGRILYWNHGAEKLYGLRRDEAVGKNVYSLLQTEFPKPLQQITEDLYQHNRWEGEIVKTRRDGQRVFVHARWALDRDERGNPFAVLVTETDITERKQAEESLRHAQAQLADRAGQLERLVAERTADLTVTNKQLKAFLYSIAHDLRGPLRAMQGFSSILLDEDGPALSESGRDYAKRISKSALFMDALLNDLLAFSQINQQRIELTAVKLGTVVESVLSRLQNEIRETNARVESPGK